MLVQFTHPEVEIIVRQYKLMKKVRNLLRDPHRTAAEMEALLTKVESSLKSCQEVLI